MSPSLADLLPSLLAIAALALLLVFVMVRWSRAMLAPRPPGTDWVIGPWSSAAALWGLAYVFAWAALIGVLLSFFQRMGSADTFGNLSFLLLVAAGWMALNALIIAFGRALMRANQRTAAAAEALAVEEPVPAGIEPAGEAAPVAPVGPRSRLRDTLLLVRNVVLALLIIAIGEALPQMQRLHAWVAAHQRSILLLAIPAGVIGFALFMGGVIHLILSAGAPMSRREIDDLAARHRALAAGPALWKRYSYQTKGLAVGAQAEDRFTVAEVKAAWKVRAWEVSPRWRRIFVILTGVALFATCLFACLFALSSAGVQLLLGGVWAYAAVRTALAFLRA